MQTTHHAVVRRSVVAVLLLTAALAGCSGDDAAAPEEVETHAWTHVPGTCPAPVEGAVLARSGSGCGGEDLPFDTYQAYLPFVLRDVASPAAPCPGIQNGSLCYRMWYVGNTPVEDGEARRVGYAVSPDGVTWTRVPGPAADRSILDPAGGDAFDSHGMSSPSVLRDGDRYLMWYVGLGPDNRIQGIGVASSTDAMNWTRIAGDEEGGAVLRESATPGRFDQHEVISAVVLRDVATEARPCAGAAAGEPCYRMWFEGVDTDDYYRYRVGYAVSPDGVRWSKVDGADPSGAVLGLGPEGSFESVGVGIPNVIADGPLLQMWYEAYDGERYTIGHAVSVDGVAWTRSETNGPVLTGEDDPGTFDDDSVWTAAVLKEGTVYRMWYSVSAKPHSERIGTARSQPGAALAGLTARPGEGTLEVTLTVGVAIPAGGSILVTLPPGLDPVSARTSDGVAATVGPTVTDAAAGGVARPAVLVPLPDGAPPGTVTVVVDVRGEATGDVAVQTFGVREVLEQGIASI